MADEIINLNGIVQATSGLSSTIYMTLIFLFVIAVFFGIFYIIFFRMQFKHKIELRKRTGEQYVAEHGIAREYDDKGGVKKWEIWGGLFRFKRKNFPAPTHQSIYVDSKGRKCAIGIQYDDETVRWVDSKTPDFNESSNFKGLDSNTRAILVSEELRKFNRKPKSAWDTIKEFALPVMLVVFVICMVLFWENITKPTVEIAQANIQVMQSLERISNNQAETVQLLYTMLEKEGIKPDAQPPN